MNESNELVRLAVKSLEDKQAADIKIIDISEISIFADYFVIATGNNRNQIQAIVNHLEETISKAGYPIRQIEGYASANWILMDCQDVIIHIFDPPNRSFYNLERIWSDGKERKPESL